MHKITFGLRVHHVLIHLLIFLALSFWNSGELYSQEISAETVNPTCVETSNGSINLAVTGGTTPYTFAWNGPGVNASTSQDLENLSEGSYTVTVTDDNGNTDSTSINLIVTDSEAPTISCLSDQNKTTDSGNCDYTVQGAEFNPSSFDDNCTGATISNNYNNSDSLAGATFPLGTTNVIWTVTDASGNTQTCNFDVIVTDEEDPTISCVGDQNKATDSGNCDYTVQGTEFSPTTFDDNCTGATSLITTIILIL